MFELSVIKEIHRENFDEKEGHFLGNNAFIAFLFIQPC